MVSKDPKRRKEIALLAVEARKKKGWNQPSDFGKRVSEGIKNKIKNNPEFAKQWSEKSRKGALFMQNRYKFTPEELAKGGRNSNINHRSNGFPLKTKSDFKTYYDLEKKLIFNRKDENNTIFMRSVIDGIEITNDGILRLLEVKMNSAKLNKNQKKLQELLSNVKKVEYIIIHHDI